MSAMESNGGAECSPGSASFAREHCNRGAQERGRTFFVMSAETNEFDLIQFHVSTEPRGMFLHMIDG